MEFNHIFKKDFDRLIDLINKKVNFSIVRLGDGEMALINGRPIGPGTQAYNVDQWGADNKLYKLGIDMKTSLNHKEPNYFFGIPTINQSKSIYLSLKKIIPQSENKITFADAFINSNYNRFKKFLEELNEDVVLIASKDGVGRKTPFKIIEYFPIQNDCVNFYEKYKEKFQNDLIELGKKYKNTLFLISCGPLSPVVVNVLYKSNPNNRYIDVGSATDQIVHGKITRPYMIPGNQYNILTPIW